MDLSGKDAIKVKDNDWQSPITKFFADEEKEALAKRIEIEPSDLIFFVVDQPKIVNSYEFFFTLLAIILPNFSLIWLQPNCDNSS